MRALITGVAGQDGTYLAEFLLARGYEVSGTTRDVSSARGRLGLLGERVRLLAASLQDSTALARALESAAPDEIYNLAGQTRVGPSWSDPTATAEVNAVGAVRLLETIRQVAPRAKVFQASSCEIFEPSDQPQDETARLGASTPYGISKLHAHLSTGGYREEYALFAVSGILFNHESPRRDESFVTRKITKAAARIAAGEQQELRLGSLNVRRDWGFAGDYVEAMWMTLQGTEAADYVLGTGVAHSVRDFCDAAFRAVGLDYREYVVSDPSLVRRADAPIRVADASRARTRLGWTPRVSFTELVRMMVDADTAALR